MKDDLTFPCSVILPTGTGISLRRIMSWSLYRRSLMKRYRGIMILISCPSSLIACGSALETSAKPPVFAKGSTSLDKNKTLSGLDIELQSQKIEENQVNLANFQQRSNQKRALASSS